MNAVMSPCSGICTLDPATDLCLGCYRTLGEIAGWSTMTDTERRIIMAGLHHRRENRDGAVPSPLDVEASAP